MRKLFAVLFLFLAGVSISIAKWLHNELVAETLFQLFKHIADDAGLILVEKPKNSP